MTCRGKRRFAKRINKRIRAFTIESDRQYDLVVFHSCQTKDEFDFYAEMERRRIYWERVGPLDYYAEMERRRIYWEGVGKNKRALIF